MASGYLIRNDAQSVGHDLSRRRMDVFSDRDVSCRHRIRSRPCRRSLTMSTSPLSPQEIRAAAEAHKELGPEYSDAVVESFLERVDREIAARVDARLRSAPREQPMPPARSNGRRALLTGVAIGIFVTGVPSLLVAAGAGGVIPGDETSVLLVLAIFWAIAVAVAAFARPVGDYLRRERGARHPDGGFPKTTA
jgi:hypothetical protein